MSIWSGPFWASAAERAIRTAAQAALGALGVDLFVDVADINWRLVASIALLAALASVLTSVATGTIQGNGPGLTEVPTAAVKPQPLAVVPNQQ